MLNCIRPQRQAETSQSDHADTSQSMGQSRGQLDSKSRGLSAKEQWDSRTGRWSRLRTHLAPLRRIPGPQRPKSSGLWSGKQLDHGVSAHSYLWSTHSSGSQDLCSFRASEQTFPVGFRSNVRFLVWTWSVGAHFSGKKFVSIFNVYKNRCFEDLLCTRSTKSIPKRRNRWYKRADTILQSLASQTDRKTG